MRPTLSAFAYPELPPAPSAFAADRAEPALPRPGRRFIAQRIWTENLSSASRLRAASDHRALALLDELRCERERRGEGRQSLTDRTEPTADRIQELSPGWRVLERAARDGQNLEDFYAVRAGLEATAEQGPDAVARAGVATCATSR